MKIFTNKKLWQKILIIILMVVVLQTVAARPVHADVVELGGKLVSPIMSLLISLGDGVMNILHSSIMGVDSSLIEVQTNAPWWDVFIGILAAIITVAACIGAVIASGGLAVILGGIALASILSSTLFGSNVVFNELKEGFRAVGSIVNEDQLPDKLYLPIYSYSPEEIFKGNILLFNVDFFRDPIHIHVKFNDDTSMDTYRNK